MSKPETIEKWEKDRKPALVAEAIAKCALKADVGQITAIGMKVRGGDSTIWTQGGRMDQVDGAANWIESRAVEAEILTYFFGAVSEVPAQTLALVRLAGFNIIDFDLRYLVRRCLILGVKVPEWMPRNLKPWDTAARDLMMLWGEPIKADRLCRALGVQTSAYDGAQMPLFHHDGRHKDIAEHCLGDLHACEQIDDHFRAVGL